MGSLVLASIILTLMLYTAGYYLSHKEYFIYADSCKESFVGECQIIESVPPVYICSQGEFGNEKCQWSNVPIGKENMFLSKENPQLFFLLTHQNLIFAFLLIPVAIFCFKKRKEIKEAFHQIQSLEWK